MHHERQCLMCSAPLTVEFDIVSLLRREVVTYPRICSDCQRQIIPYRVDNETCYCRCCKRPLSEQSDDVYRQCYHDERVGSVCHDCLMWLTKYPLHYLQHDALLQYNAYIKEWLYRYKYVGDVRLVSLVRPYLQQYQKQYPEYQWLYLPSSSKSLTQRHFHATFELLHDASINAVCPFDYCGDNIKQASKTKKERLKLQPPFKIHDAVCETLLKTNGKLIVFDDVYTTGATMMAAKRILFDWFEKRIEKENLEIMSVSIARDVLDQV